MRLGEDVGGDGGGGRISPEHASPILHAPRDNISCKGKSLCSSTLLALLYYYYCYCYCYRYRYYYYYYYFYFYYYYYYYYYCY